MFFTITSPFRLIIPIMYLYYHIGDEYGRMNSLALGRV